MSHIKWPSIESFHQVRKHVHACTPLVNNNPAVTYRGKVKLHGCLEKDTRISYSNGVRKKICEVKIGDTILGMDENGNIVNTKVLSRFNNGSGGNWLNIKGERQGNGPAEFSIICTDKHKFYSPSTNSYLPASELSVGSPVVMLRSDYSLTPIQEQILLGKLLGDASIRNHSSVSSLIEFGQSNHEYLDFTCKMLGSIASGHSYRRISGFGSEIKVSRTISSSLIKERFESFINEKNKKIVPEWVINKLNPIAMAFWYMDDGSLAHLDSQEDRANFAVCGFSKQDCDNLLLALKKYDINGTYYISQNKNDVYYSRIRLNANEAEKLFILIAPYIPPCMQYKLPERYRGCPGWLPLFGEEYKPATYVSKITSISVVEKKLSQYDLETDVHSYIANGIIVHNSNACVQVCPTDTYQDEDKNNPYFKVEAQSRTQIITPEADNYVFAKWVHDNMEGWSTTIPWFGFCNKFGKDIKSICYFGEWAGLNVQHGVALNNLKGKIFAVFAILVTTENPDVNFFIVEPRDIMFFKPIVEDLYILPWYGDTVTVNWFKPAEDLKEVVDALNKAVGEVERCDPWVKDTFGIEGIGEGIVYYPMSVEHSGYKCFGDLAFKAKGEKHKVVNQKKPVQASPEVAENISAFIDLVLTEARLEQGVQEGCAGNFDTKFIGPFIGWMSKDVNKECQAELEASGLEWKEVVKELTAKVRLWYMQRIGS